MNAPTVVTEVPNEAPQFFRFTPVAAAMCAEFGILIARPRVSFVAFVAAGGPFTNY